MSRFVRFFLHLGGWLLIFLFNYLFLHNLGLSFHYERHIYAYLIAFFVFYSHYFFIIPLLLKRKFFLFYFLSALVLTGAIGFKYQLGQYYGRMSGFESRQQVMPEGERLPPQPMEPHMGQEPPAGQLPQKGLEPPMGQEPRQGEKPGKNQPPVLPFRHPLIFEIFTVFFVFLASMSIRFILKWQGDEKQKIVLEKEKTHAELSFLKQQINPHFLFNSLNSIYSQAITQSEEVKDSILMLSSVLRYILYESQNELVALKDELRIMEDYILLHKLRLTDKVKLDLQVKGEVGNHKIEPLLLVPFIENAFKYGVDNVNESFINIYLEVQDQFLEFKVTNKIIGAVEEEKYSGIGVKNIQRRLELLYPDKHEMHISTASDIFFLRMKLELKS